MAFLRNLVFSAAALVTVSIAPLTAHAIEVECEAKDESTCTVSNDPFDTLTCECSEDGGGGSTGGESWADFDEEMLLEVCEAQLDFCATGGETDEGTSTTANDTTDSDSDTDSSDSDSTSSGTTGDGESSGDGTTGGESTTGGSDTTSDTTSGGNSGPSTNPAETDSNGTSPSDGDDTGPAGDDTSPGGEESGDESSSGADQDEQDPSGCRVGGGGSPGALLTLFGIALGVRRRR